jgi:hypothetical protein
MLVALALAVATATTATTATAARADVPGPRCDAGTYVVVSGACVFGHPALTSLSVSATATGVPGLTAVRIEIQQIDETTGTLGAVVLACEDTSDDLTDPTAACAASRTWSGRGTFLCRIESSFTAEGTCSTTAEE